MTLEEAKRITRELVIETLNASTVEQLTQLEKRAYDHLRDFYVDDDEDFEKAEFVWGIIRKILKYTK